MRLWGIAPTPSAGYRRRSASVVDPHWRFRHRCGCLWQALDARWNVTNNQCLRAAKDGYWNLDIGAWNDGCFTVR